MVKKTLSLFLLPIFILPFLSISCSCNNSDDSNNNQQQKPTKPAPPNNDSDEVDGLWKPYGLRRKKFSYNNSLKVTFKKGDNSDKSVSLTNGTAWTLDIQNNNHDVTWYLMTNYHVVEAALKYNRQNTNLVNNVQEITKGFIIGKPRENDKITVPAYGAYDLLSSKNLNLKGYEKGKFEIKKIEVISDFNDETIELFSKGNLYNLDMAIIKITLDPNEYQKQIDFFNNLNQPLDLKKEYPKYLGKKVFIAGNPGKDKKLMVDDIDLATLKEKSEGKDRFKGFYYDSNIISESEWLLSSGASGSPVYSWDENLQQNTYPIGIYWGTWKHNGGQEKEPSFYPFITKAYNIWDNIYLLMINNYF